MSITTYTNCLRIERTDGYVICLTELDKDIIINDTILDGTWASVDQTYLTAAGYTPTNMQSTSDNAVNNADVEGVLSSVGVQREDIIGGRYDFAKLHIFLWDFTNNTLIKKLGSGHWGEVTIKDGSYVAEFRSLSQQLQQTIGRTYNPECDEQLGGPRCSIPLGLFPKEDGNITAQTSKSFLIDSSLSMPDDYWNDVTLLWTSGDNDTESSIILDYIDADNKIILTDEMPNYISLTDTYTMTKPELLTETVDKAGSSTEFTDSTRTEGDNYFTGNTMIIDTGDNIGNTYDISNFISNKYTLSLLTGTALLFAIGDTYHIDKPFSGSIETITTQRTTFEDTTRLEANDYFNTLTLTFTSGLNNGLTATITDFISLTGQFIIDAINLTNDLVIGDTYSITKTYSSSATLVDLKKEFIDTSLIQPDNYYAGMTLEFLTGSNLGHTSIISSYINNIFLLATATTNNIINTDTYKVDYIKNSVTTDGASKIKVIDSNIGITDYSGMYIEFNTGLNEGEFRQISSSETGLLTLVTPFDYNILNSDTYIIINMTGDTYMTLGEVVTITDDSIFTATILEDGTFGDDYFNYGKLIFKSGLNDELHMEVKDFDEATNTFTLFLPMPFEIAIGDNFQVFAGCDKRLETCKTKFNIIANPTSGNIINFQGFPYIPGQDQISLFGGQ